MPAKRGETRASGRMVLGMRAESIGVHRGALERLSFALMVSFSHEAWANRTQGTVPSLLCSRRSRSTRR